MLTKAQRAILDKIMEPGDRSKQRLVGASQLGGCPYHLGLAMLESKKPVPKPGGARLGAGLGAGLGAWLGTQMHYSLEHNLNLGEAELKVDIFELEDYGRIKGNIDLIYENEIFDWKLLGKFSFDNMKLDFHLEPDRLPKTQYRVQQHCYAYGARKAGHEITHVNIVAFPKMSNRFEDIEFYREPYNEELVLKTIDRAKMIWQYCQEGKLEELPRDLESCYSCSMI